MSFAVASRDIRNAVLGLLALVGLLFAAQGLSAAVPATSAPETTSAAEAGDAADAQTAATGDEEAAQGSYEPLGPEWIKGQPTSFEDDPWKTLNFQDQYTEDGKYAEGMNSYILTPVIVAISLFVAILLLLVIVRFRRREGREPSRTTHNTLIEVIWTIVPVLILVVIAVPSITLLARQYKTAPEEAITIKATGYQWYWGYTYPDQGGFEVISYMLNEPGQPVINQGKREVGSEAWDGPAQLEVDNRMVVPVGVPLRIQTIGADVIHSFAVPSLWFKLDAVPGRINERVLTINEPGIYYGQCSELCGAKHGYMPIAIEAVPMERWREWVRSKGGTFENEAAASDAVPVGGTAESTDAEESAADATETSEAGAAGAE